MDHTGLTLQTTPYLPLPCERSPDGATWTADIWFSSLLIYRPRKDERLSWHSWLTYSGRYTHISGHTSTTDRAEARESSPVRDRRSNHWATQLYTQVDHNKATRSTVGSIEPPLIKLMAFLPTSQLYLFHLQSSVETIGFMSVVVYIIH